MKKKGLICKRCEKNNAIAKGFCNKCYYATKRGYKINEETLRERNYKEKGKYYLSDRKGNKWEVDKEDFNKCKIYFWNDNGNGYAKSMKVGYLHRYICPQYKIVDHIDRNPYNCKQENLREGKEINSLNKICTAKSGYKGVHESKGKWQARPKRKCLGTFNTKDEAHKKVLEWAKENNLLEFYII